MVKKNDNIDSTAVIKTEEYIQTLSALKQQIQESQVKVMLSANKELLKLYWHIGKMITEKQLQAGWGTQTIEQLAKDLQNTFTGISGFSRANIFRMKAFFAAHEKVAQLVRQIDDLPVFAIPWGHNIMIIQNIGKKKMASMVCKKKAQ